MEGRAIHTHRIFHPLVNVPNDLNSQVGPGTRSFIWIFPLSSKGPSNWAIFNCFPRHISRNCVGSGAARTPMASIQDAMIASGAATGYSTLLALLDLILIKQGEDKDQAGSRYILMEKQKHNELGRKYPKKSWVVMCEF